jgi:hypothetical protein
VGAESAASGSSTLPAGRSDGGGDDLEYEEYYADDDSDDADYYDDDDDEILTSNVKDNFSDNDLERLGQELGLGELPSAGLEVGQVL